MITRPLLTTRWLAALASPLALAAMLGSARAGSSCGDGIVNIVAGEQCDDGNLLAGDCCSPGCQFESADTACRPALDPCDAVEHCTGTSAICPPDTGILGDLDGDLLCDPLDVCPDVSDPLQIDRDGDGIGDACDPCTNIASGLLSYRLRIRKLDLSYGQQRIKFRAAVSVPSTPAIDPPSKGLRLMVTDARQQPVLDVTVPPITYDSGTRTGWATLGGGSKWVFFDGADSVEGVDKAVVRVVPSGDPNTTSLRVMIVSGGDTKALVPEFPVTLALVIDAPIAVDGQCAEVTPRDGDCIFRNEGAKLLCHASRL